MGREVGQIVIGVVLVIALEAVVRGSLRSTMVAVGPDASGTPSADAAVSPYGAEGARVRGASQESGTSLFGFGWGGSTRLAIEFQVADECYESVAVGDGWPSSAAGCAGEAPVVGEVTRKLRDEWYGGLLVVEMGVSKGCFAVAAGGGPWPTGQAECAEEEGR